MDTEVTLRKRRSCPWVNTLCRRGNTCVCCNWRQHLQRLSPHGLHWPTVDEGLDAAALTSISLMLLGRRNATTGGSRNNLASVSLFSKIYIIDHNPSWKENKDIKKRVFGSASYKHYTRRHKQKGLNLRL
jgi:hypothetical protein